LTRLEFSGQNHASQTMNMAGPNMAGPNGHGLHSILSKIF
jgi:hypothetical protein